MLPWLIGLAVVAGSTGAGFAVVSWYRSPKQRKRRRTRQYLRNNLCHLDIKRPGNTDGTYY